MGAELQIWKVVRRGTSVGNAATRPSIAATYFGPFVSDWWRIKTPYALHQAFYIVASHADENISLLLTVAV